MKNPSNLEYHLGLMEKQSKRIAELARFLPFADQQQEMERVATDLEVTASYFRRFFQPT
jgi:methylphosphotriester-DNA--protein-cysteine methyltransferase